MPTTTQVVEGLWQIKLGPVNAFLLLDERRGRSDSRRVLGGAQRRKAAFAARAAGRNVISQADLKVRLYVSDVRTHHESTKRLRVLRECAKCLRGLGRRT